MKTYVFLFLLLVIPMTYGSTVRVRNYSGVDCTVQGLLIPTGHEVTVSDTNTSWIVSLNGTNYSETIDGNFELTVGVGSYCWTQEMGPVAWFVKGFGLAAVVAVGAWGIDGGPTIPPGDAAKPIADAGSASQVQRPGGTRDPDPPLSPTDPVTASVPHHAPATVSVHPITTAHRVFPQHTPAGDLPPTSCGGERSSSGHAHNQPVGPGQPPG